MSKIQFDFSVAYDVPFSTQNSMRAFHYLCQRLGRH